MENVNDTFQSTIVTNKRKKKPSKCKICGVPALYSYCGAIVCSSCKVFFKRNAETKQDKLKCPFDGHCEIDINNRRICSCCRLAKCFSSGMQTELFRGSISVSTKKSRTEKAAMNIIVKRNELQHFPTLNLLRSDQSTLTTEQWNLLSNLIHCYDEYSKFSTAQNFIYEQNNLPIKMRFKSGPVGELLTSCTAGAQLLFEKNADFVSLCSHDRSLLLHNSVKYVGGLGTCFTLHCTGLFDNPAFYTSSVDIYGTIAFDTGRCTGAQLDSDLVVAKLIFEILIFSTPSYVYYTDTAASNLKDIKPILHFQEMYVELTWRYLLYKYDHKRAVLCFSNLIRCLFTLHKSITAAAERQQYKDMIDSIVKQTEMTISISE